MKHINLSQFVGTDIDCEFSDRDDFTNPVIGKLSKCFDTDQEYTKPYRQDVDGRYWKYCRPRMNGHIHAYNRGPANLSDIFKGFKLSHVYGQLGSPMTFIVEGLAEGYTWPWEAETVVRYVNVHEGGRLGYDGLSVGVAGQTNSIGIIKYNDNLTDVEIIKP